MFIIHNKRNRLLNYTVKALNPINITQLVNSPRRGKHFGLRLLRRLSNEPSKELELKKIVISRNLNSTDSELVLTAAA